MASVKNRIKAEQGSQRESCPHRGAPPSQPGATRLQGQKRKEPLHRCRPGVAALRQVKKLQKPAELYIPFAPFVRLVREITKSCSREVSRWTPEALLWLQDAADFHLKETVEVEIQLTIRAKSVIIKQEPGSSSRAGTGNSALVPLGDHCNDMAVARCSNPDGAGLLCVHPGSQ